MRDQQVTALNQVSGHMMPNNLQKEYQNTANQEMMMGDTDSAGMYGG